MTSLLLYLAVSKLAQLSNHMVKILTTNNLWLVLLLDFFFSISLANTNTIKGKLNFQVSSSIFFVFFLFVLNPGVFSEPAHVVYGKGNKKNNPMIYQWAAVLIGHIVIAPFSLSKYSLSPWLAIQRFLCALSSHFPLANKTLQFSVFQTISVFLWFVHN